MSGDYLWDQSGPRDPEVVRLESLLKEFGQSSPPAPLRDIEEPAVVERSPWFAWVWAPAAAAIVTAVVGTVWWTRPPAEPGLQVTRLIGAPTVGSRVVSDRQELNTGRWLETDGASRARIDIGDIGRVEVEPRTRLGLVRTRPGDYRLQLDRGTMHALIWAPPGQFAVETSSSTAIDLGCSYTLSVDDEGVGTVKVTTGWVGFEWQGRESFIPAGAMCLTRPGRGPGTPYYEDATPEFRAAVDTLDFGAGSTATRASALERVLADARAKDAVTLWHLLGRTNGDARDKVFDRLAQFVRPSDGVTREGIRAGGREMLDEWWDHLGLGTASWWRTWKQTWRDRAPGK